HILRIGSTTHELLASGDSHTVADNAVGTVEIKLETGTARHDVLNVVLTVITHQYELAAIVGLVDTDDTGSLSQRRLTL
ncbi:hypothetical protein M1186_25975, partial [Salmonella enterica subsp. enterica serovar Minnesota]|nr:hypothetical protein [Salmonella enterica subsp. enterica serovar Minnesota]